CKRCSLNKVALSGSVFQPLHCYDAQFAGRVIRPKRNVPAFKTLCLKRTTGHRVWKRFALLKRVVGDLLADSKQLLPDPRGRGRNLLDNSAVENRPVTNGHLVCASRSRQIRSTSSSEYFSPASILAIRRPRSARYS